MAEYDDQPVCRHSRHLPVAHDDLAALRPGQVIEFDMLAGQVPDPGAAWRRVLQGLQARRPAAGTRTPARCAGVTVRGML